MEPACCWQKDEINAADCPSLPAGGEALLGDRRRRFLELCLDCPRFRGDLQAFAGETGTPLALFADAINELLELRGQVEARRRENRFLHEVGLVLQTSVDMDEVIAMALTAVTAGSGFGFNRAIVLLVDRERQTLRGHLAVGPSSREDAGRIWQKIEERKEPLREMARRLFEEEMGSEREKFRELLATLTVPLQRGEHLFVRAMEGRQSLHVRELCREPGLDPLQAETLECTEMALVPLRSENRRIGLLLADNLITGRAITPGDLQSLETFALPVAFAIERAAHYERLRDELEKRAEANRRLHEQQEQILRMEKMALVGNLTANIAHSIRNPLTIIGGFARTLARQTSAEDERRSAVDALVREAKRLEEALEEILSYSESLHPSLDLWDVNRLLAEVHDDLREQLEAAGVSAQLELEEGLPPIEVDIKKLAYCLRTVLRHALEGMAEGGALTLGSARRDDRLLLTLCRIGTAVDPEVLRATGDATLPFDGRGEGVGLALCARILKDHGADLGIENADDRTTYTLNLPLPKEKTDDPTAGG